MNGEQFNELLSYVMLNALNSTQLLFQQTRQRHLTGEEVGACQDYLLHHARKLQDALNNRTGLVAWPPVPPVGRADE